MLDNRSCDLIRATLNTSEEEQIRFYALAHFSYYADNINYLALNTFTPNEYRFARNTIEKKKPDIFEVLDRLLFPYDPIRDWSEREVKKIDERFKPIENLIDFAYS